MKKVKLLYLLASCLTFSLLSTSCSDDDDDNNESNSNIELYINGVKQKINNFVDSPIIYDNNEFQFSTYFGDEESGNIIFFNFDDISLNDLAVGDDLTNKTSWGDYDLFYENDFYKLFDNHPVLTNTQYKQYLGQAIVKEFDKNNGTIKVEFSNIKIPTFDAGDPYKQPEKTATVKAVFSGKIDFD